MMWIYGVFMVLLSEAWSQDPGMNFNTFYSHVVLVLNDFCHGKIQLVDKNMFFLRGAQNLHKNDFVRSYMLIDTKQHCVTTTIN